jgi:predicted nucleic-acid-binding protein
MTTAIDTNILVALWNEDDFLNTLARSALDDAFGRGGLVIAAPVFAELFRSFQFWRAPGWAESKADVSRGTILVR